MRTRLNSCDRLHPGKGSDIHWYTRKDRSMGRLQHCKECNRIAARLRARGDRVPKPVEMIQTPRNRPYDVIRLSWTPPSI